MRDLIGYFKQYTVRRNCQELKTTFYTSAKESAYMSTYQKYSLEREKYADDAIEISHEQEIYDKWQAEDELRQQQELEAESLNK